MKPICRSGAIALWLPLVLLDVGCTEPIQLGDTQAQATTDATDNSAVDTGDAPTDGAKDRPDPSGTGGPSTTAATTGADEGSDGEGMVVMDPDTPDVRDCSTWDNDCPRGEKCTFWASNGGGPWDATRCVPIVDNPDGLGEACEVTGDAASGLDTCDAQMMCWNVDSATNVGHCTGLCTGSPSEPTCADSCSSCSVSGGPLAVCLNQCHPVLQDCPDGEACYPLGETFACAPNVSGDKGHAGEPCEHVNACDSGTVCGSPDMWPPGACEPGAGGCCIPTCDTQAADPCPNTPEGVVCVPWYAEGEAPPATECHDWSVVGVCSLP